MKKVRLGIIGYGNMGSGHAGYLRQGAVPECELTAVADVRPERLKAAAADCGEKVATFSTAEALIASGTVDAVLIATPHYDHPPLAIAAFKAGLHVLSEKPAGVYGKQVRQMNEVAKASGKVFGLMFNQRTEAMHQKMREMVASGELGEIRRTNWIITNWFRPQCYYDSGGWRATWAGEGGGVLLNQCPHNLDLWQWIGGMPSRIRAFIGFGKTHKIEVDDEVTAYAEYPNGATGLFITSTGEAPGTNRFEVVGDQGKLVLEDGKLLFHRNRVPADKFLKTSKELFSRPECWKIDLTCKGGDGHRAITQDFARAILKGTPLLAPGVEGIRGLDISNAMLLSAWLDRWVDLPVDEEVYHRELKKRIKTSRFKKTVVEKTSTVS